MPGEKWREKERDSGTQCISKPPLTARAGEIAELLMIPPSPGAELSPSRRGRLSTRGPAVAGWEELGWKGAENHLSMLPVLGTETGNLFMSNSG